MPLKILVVPDKFKGTLDAPAAAAAIARGWLAARPKDRVEVLPMTDGGDGFGLVMSRLLGARAQTTRTVDAAHRSCSARWWWEPRSRTALIETARVIGLAMLPPGRFHPFELDTFGIGAVLQAAIKKGARRILAGIGGSATNDGGFGLARALGWTFVDDHGDEIVEWPALTRLGAVKGPRMRGLGAQVIVAVDVENRLLGARGATRVYGPQKGLREADFAVAERSLRRLAAVCDPEGRYARAPGAGAAGGLGFGFQKFVRARLERGFEMFAGLADLDRHLRWADIVVTGEGRIDRSTVMGKGVGEIAKRCRAAGIPCIGLGGTVELSRKERALFARAAGLTDLTSLAQAKRQPERWLERLARRVSSLT